MVPADEAQSRRALIGFSGAKSISLVGELLTPQYLMADGAARQEARYKK
jgi:hypothetical protein